MYSKNWNYLADWPSPGSFVHPKQSRSSGHVPRSSCCSLFTWKCLASKISSGWPVGFGNVSNSKNQRNNTGSHFSEPLWPCWSSYMPEMRSRQTQQNHPRIDKANWCNEVHWCGIQAIPFGLSMSIGIWNDSNIILHFTTSHPVACSLPHLLSPTSCFPRLSECFAMSHSLQNLWASIEQWTWTSWTGHNQHPSFSAS